MKIQSVKLCPYCKETLSAEATIANNQIVGFTISKIGDPLETAHNTQIPQEKAID